MSKQTAVEWLIEHLADVGIDYVLGQHNDLIVQAKAMEREQIIDAYGDGINGHRNDFCNRDEYFIKTFGDVF